jgi:hypothetical protein
MHILLNKSYNMAYRPHICEPKHKLENHATYAQ